MNHKLYCDNKFIECGGRTAIKIDLEDLRAKVIAEGGYPSFFNGPDIIHFGVLMENNSSILKDLQKIKFKIENVSMSNNRFGNDNDKWLGFNRVGDLSFLGLLAGGAWEDPVFFIIYYDGKELRGYVPIAGNIFRNDIKAAFGSDMDDKYFSELTVNDPLLAVTRKKEYNNQKVRARKQENVKFLKDYLNFSDDTLSKVKYDYIGGIDYKTFDFDWDWIIKDITSKIIAS